MSHVFSMITSKLIRSTCVPTSNHSNPQIITIPVESVQVISTDIHIYTPFVQIWSVISVHSAILTLKRLHYFRRCSFSIVFILEWEENTVVVCNNKLFRTSTICLLDKKLWQCSFIIISPKFKSVIRYDSGYHPVQFADNYNALVKSYHIHKQTDKHTIPILRTASPNAIISLTNIIKLRGKQNILGDFRLWTNSYTCPVPVYVRKRKTNER